MRKINRKIPGILPPPIKTEVDGKVTDLSSKTVLELIELRDRQLKLLNNKPFISKLTDKGEKIQSFYDKIVIEIKAKKEEEATCQLFNNLNLNSVDRDLVQDIEWKGKLEPSKQVLDSDDDSDPEDLMSILSQNVAEKKVKILESLTPLITAQVLVNIGNTPHIKYIVDKTEHNLQPSTFKQFKPYHTTKSDVHDPSKEILRKKHKHWEITAATPPPIIHEPAKVLSIEESLILQIEYTKHLKEVEAKHAAEKLKERTGVDIGEIPKTMSFSTYREMESDCSKSEDEQSDNEVHDDEPERGGVVFTVMK